MSSENWLDKFHAAINVLNEVNAEIRHKASVFREVGNKKISDELVMCAKDICYAKKLIQKALSENLNESLASSQQSTAAMLNAVMAGVTLGDKYANNRAEEGA